MEKLGSRGKQVTVMLVVIHLVKPVLLRHSDGDVRLAITLCIVNVMRITAPHDPYSKEVMKEIFHSIVEGFQGLGDIDNRTFGKKVKILESIAKIKACVIMLDLG